MLSETGQTKWSANNDSIYVTIQNTAIHGDRKQIGGCQGLGGGKNGS